MAFSILYVGSFISLTGAISRKCRSEDWSQNLILASLVSDAVIHERGIMPVIAFCLSANKNCRRNEGTISHDIWFWFLTTNILISRRKGYPFPILVCSFSSKKGIFHTVLTRRYYPAPVRSASELRTPRSRPMLIKTGSRNR